MPPLLTFAKTAAWDQADKETQAAFGQLTELLGDGCDELDLPEPFEHAVDWHRAIMNADLAKNLAGYYERGEDKLTDVLKDHPSPAMIRAWVGLSTMSTSPPRYVL